MVFEVFEPVTFKAELWSTEGSSAGTRQLGAGSGLAVNTIEAAYSGHAVFGTPSYMARKLAISIHTPGSPARTQTAPGTPPCVLGSNQTSWPRSQNPETGTPAG